MHPVNKARINRLPFRTLTLGPHKFDVILSEAEIQKAEEETGSRGLYGWFSEAESTICIKPGLSASMCVEVVLHEVMHAVHTFFLPGNAQEEEEYVKHYAFGLSTILRQNPRLARWILETLQG